MDFDELKENVLGREDKSKKGSWDDKITALCQAINESKNYFTSSSCAGRIVLFEHLGPKKNQASWWFVSHDITTPEEIINAFHAYPGNHPLEFKQQSAIVHVGCRTQGDAQNLVELGLRSGFKRSGIISTRKKYVVELLCTEQLAVPVYDTKPLVDDEYLTYLTNTANEKLRKSWQAIDRLHEQFKQPLTEDDEFFRVNKKYLVMRTYQVVDLLKILSQHMRITGETVLSLGCGTAPELRILSEHFTTKIGVDHNAQMIEFCKRIHRSNITFVHRNHITFLTEQDEGSIDYIFALDIDTNIFLRTLIKEALPKLKHGGSLVISERAENKSIYGRMLLEPYIDQIKESIPKGYTLQCFHFDERERDNCIITITKYALKEQKLRQEKKDYKHSPIL